MRSRLFGLVFVVVSTPFALSAALATGCGGGGGGTGPTSPSASAKPATPDAALTAPPDGGPAMVVADAHQPEVNDGNIWGPVLVAADAGAETGGPCWKGFAPTGNAEADVVELGKRCAAGMSQVVPPVKHVFKQGEAKVIPVPIAPGCYRVIAVGGKGVKDVDLELKDPSGKVVAADKTPDDIFPMIHPNKEFCAEALQILQLTISVKKGSGDVAGGVWKR